MDITPLTNLVKRDIVYNSDLCLICQKNPKEKLVRKPLESVLKTILDGKENADQLGNLSHDSPATLLEKRYSYHKRCRSVEDLKRKRLENSAQSDSDEELINTSPHKRRLTRSMLPQFDINICIICQEETNEKTHRASSEARDQQIKQAFQIAPRTLAPVKVRFESAVDASAGEIRYHQSCWVKGIERARSDYPLVSDESERELEREIILRDIVDAAVIELAKGNVLSVPNLVSAFQRRMDDTNIMDKIERRQITRHIIAYFEEHEPNIAIEKSPILNQGNRLVVKDYQKFALDIAVRAKREECNTEVDHLKHAAKILRRNLINFKESITEHFQGSVMHDMSNLPPILGIFLEQLIAGDRSLNDSRTKDVKRDICSIANSLIYCIRSDRQMTYNPCVIDSTFYNKSPTLQQIGIGLTVHQATRNKQVINLLSDYKLSIPYHQVERLETAIGDCIIDKMNENDGTYIPLNFRKGIIPIFHIDNIDFSEDTPDGRSTTHALNCVAFQPKQPNIKNKIILDLPKHPKNKCLKTNSFGILKDCTKPSVKDFHHNKGFDIASTQSIPLSNFRTWVFAKAMEFLCSGYGKTFLVQLGRGELTDMHIPGNDTEGDTNDLIRCPLSESTLLNVSVEEGSTQHGALKKLENLISNSFDEMEIPSFGAMNSIVGEEVNESDLTNVATMPLIPGPASNFSAIYTAMNRAQDINNWCCGVTGKTIISLDLDLYEKVYLLVNSRNDLRGRYILRLGELHIVFAMIRAIGTYIEGSGIDQSWVKSGWFGENTVKQVLTCSHMKRALDAHESTVIALYVLYLRSFFMENTDLLNDFENTLSIITKLRSENMEEVRMTFSVLEEFLNEPQINDKLQCFDQKRQNNAEFKFLMTYMEMVKVLLKFIYASRSRNWLMHLNVVQEMIPYITSMDRIKYRRMLPVYLADMKRIENEDPAIWKFFSDGNFSVQTTKIPATAKGVDHAGEQENKKLKIQGGLIGITRRENSRDKYFLIAHVVAEIEREMRQIGGSEKKQQHIHHMLNKYRKGIQSNKVVSLVKTFDTFKLQFTDIEDHRLYNIVTGRVFPDAARDVLEVYNKGSELFHKFTEERLQISSEVSIWAPLKKVNLMTFKKCDKPQPQVIEGKVYHLENHCDLFGKLALIAQDVDSSINIQNVISNFECSTIARSLFDISGQSNKGYENKSQLVHTVCNNISEAWTDTHKNFDLVVFDAMSVLHTLRKTEAIKNFHDLAYLFIELIEIQTNSAAMLIISFDTYLSSSLKQLTRQRRKGDEDAVIYDVCGTTDISKISMKQILSHNETKRALTKFLISAIHDYLRKKEKTFIIAGNGVTISSYCDVEGVNNHEESDTLMRHCLSLVDVTGKIVCVKSNDTDVFVIMLGLMHRLDCQQLLIEWSGEKWIDVTRVYQEIGRTKAEALIGFHCFSGCDTVEKFSGKSKAKWTTVFLKSPPNIITAFSKLCGELDDDILSELEMFTAGVYNPKNKKPQTLGEVRWLLFLRELRRKHKYAPKKKGIRNVFELMPPTSGAFLQHVRRSHIVAKTLSQSDMAIIEHANPDGFGWIIKDEKYESIVSEEPMAPVELLNPESCGCNTTCSTGHCPCRKKPAKPCSQFCGCDEKCENTDPAPEEIIEQDDDDSYEDDAEMKKICICSGKCATVRCYCRSEGLSCNYKCCCKECTNNKPHNEESDGECEDDIVDESIGNKYPEI